MSVQTRTIPGPVIEYSANNKVFEKLDRGWVLRELYIRLTGKVDITGAGSAGSAPMNPESIVQNFALKRNTTEDRISLDLHALARFCRVFFPSTLDVGRKTIDPSQTGEQEFELALVVPLWQPHVVKPLEWAFDGIDANDIRLEVQWGALSDLIGDATGTFVTEPQIEVSEYKHTGGARPPNRGWRITNMVSEQIDSAGESRKLELDPGEMFRGYLVRTMSGDPVKPADDVLNSLRLTTGAETFWDVDRRQLETMFALRRDQGAHEPGYYWFDELGDGYATEALDSLGFKQLNFRADVNAPTNAQIDIYPVEMMPTRNKDG